MERLYNIEKVVLSILQGKSFYPVLGQKNYPVDAQLDRKFQPVSNIKLT